jgi:hypothetical protein
MPDLEKGVETARKLGELQGECRFYHQLSERVSNSNGDLNKRTE